MAPWHAGALHHQVRAAATGQLHDVGQGRVGVVGLDHVHVVVADAQLGGEGEPSGGAAHQDHRGRAGELGQGRRGQPDRTAALHDDDLPEPDRPALAERTHHGGAGAGQRHRGHRVGPLGKLHHRRARAQVDVLGPRARQRMSGRRRSVDAVGLAVLAQGRVAVHPARDARPTRDRRGPHDRIARTERCAGRIVGHTGAELVHGPEALVAKHQRSRHREVPPLEVQVRAAHAPVPAGDDHRPRLHGRRQLELLDREGLAEGAEHDGAATSRAARRTGRGLGVVSGRLVVGPWPPPSGGDDDECDHTDRDDDGDRDGDERHARSPLAS